MSRLSAFCDWLETTDVSQAIQKTLWVIPTVQIIHILAISAIAGSALMLNARMLRLLERDQPMSRVAARFLPVIWWALPILLLSGIVMIVGEPARALKNPIFQTKLVLILLVMAHTALVQRRLAVNAAEYDTDKKGRPGALAIVIPAAMLWLGIIFAGRWIAYY
jgi:hypothetical protein